MIFNPQLFNGIVVEAMRRYPVPHRAVYINAILHEALTGQDVLEFLQDDMEVALQEDVDIIKQCIKCVWDTVNEFKRRDSLQDD